MPKSIDDVFIRYFHLLLVYHLTHIRFTTRYHLIEYSIRKG